MNLSERVSYLKGLMDGLSIDETKPEGKLFKAIIDVLDEMSASVLDLEDDMDEMAELADNLDEDLGAVEEYLFGEDDDEDYFEVECPNCGEVICMDEDLACEGEVLCPACGENVEVDIECECGCCGEDAQDEEEE